MNCSRNHQETLSHLWKAQIITSSVWTEIYCCQNSVLQECNTNKSSFHLVNSFNRRRNRLEIFLASMALQKKFWDRSAIAVRSNNIYFSLKGEVRRISALQKRALENTAPFPPLWVLPSLWSRLLPLQQLPSISWEDRWVFLIHVSGSDWAHHPDFALERIRSTDGAHCVASNLQLVPKSNRIGKIFYALNWIIFVKHLQVKELYKC